MRTITTLVLLCLAGAAAAAPPDRTDAFESAYATSFYAFDACGDGVAGRLYRQALAARLSQCPFTDAAKARFRERSTLQRRKSSGAINAMIEQNGGLPTRLEGMSQTCHEQHSSDAYRALRSRLDDYAAGKATAQSIVPESCEAETISP
jgi:hypothetical protein